MATCRDSHPQPSRRQETRRVAVLGGAFVCLAVFGASQALAAADAYSGPRSIVPPGFGASGGTAAPSDAGKTGLGDAGPEDGGTGADGGATRTAPAQLFPSGSSAPDEPAVRVIRSTPGASGTSIQVGRLSRVDASTASLIGPDSGNLGSDMWENSRRGEIEQLLADLPPAQGSPVLINLRQRLLLTGATPPAGMTASLSGGSGGGRDFLELRLDALLTAGRANDALELAAAASKIRPASIAMLQARAALALGKGNEACDALSALPANGDPRTEPHAAFALKLSAYCQILGGNPELSDITTDLAREEGLDDPLFYSLQAAAADEIRLKAPPPETLSEIDFAFYGLAEKGFPSDAAAIAVPSVLPALAQDTNAGPKIRIDAAERAAGLGLVGGDVLGAAYEAANFTQKDFDGLKSGEYPDSSAMRRALLFQAIAREVMPRKQLQMMALALSTAEPAGLAYPTAEALKPSLDRIRIGAELAGVAPIAVRAYIVLGDIAKANAWREAMTSAGAGFGRGTRELDAMLRLMKGDTIDLPDDIGATLLGDLRSGVTSTQRFAAAEAMMLDALGADLPREVWDRILDRQDLFTGAAPREALFDQMQAASARGARGETVLLALTALADHGPSGTHANAVAEAVKSLGNTRLEGEARRLAIEALLARSSIGRG